MSNPILTKKFKAPKFGFCVPKTSIASNTAQSTAKDSSISDLSKSIDDQEAAKSTASTQDDVRALASTQDVDKAFEQEETGPVGPSSADDDEKVAVASRANSEDVNDTTLVTEQMDQTKLWEDDDDNNAADDKTVGFNDKIDKDEEDDDNDKIDVTQTEEDGNDTIVTETSAETDEKPVKSTSAEMETAMKGDAELRKSLGNLKMELTEIDFESIYSRVMSKVKSDPDIAKKYVKAVMSAEEVVEKVEKGASKQGKVKGNVSSSSYSSSSKSSSALPSSKSPPKLIEFGIRPGKTEVIADKDKLIGKAVKMRKRPKPEAEEDGSNADEASKSKAVKPVFGKFCPKPKLVIPEVKSSEVKETERSTFKSQIGPKSSTSNSPSSSSPSFSSSSSKVKKDNEMLSPSSASEKEKNMMANPALAVEEEEEGGSTDVANEESESVVTVKPPESYIGNEVTLSQTSQCSKNKGAKFSVKKAESENTFIIVSSPKKAKKSVEPASKKSLKKKKSDEASPENSSKTTKSKKSKDESEHKSKARNTAVEGELSQRKNGIKTKKQKVVHDKVEKRVRSDCRDSESEDEVNVTDIDVRDEADKEGNNDADNSEGLPGSDFLGIDFVSSLVWVQCDSCDKWRHWRKPNAAPIPEEWFCKLMDEERFSEIYNPCSVPEEVASDEESSDWLFVTRREGDLVFAKMRGYPWWPGMIERTHDPDEPEVYCYLKEDRKEEEEEGGGKKVVSDYHVTFFDTPPSVAWIPVQETIPFDGSKKEVEEMNRASSLDRKGINYKGMLNRAVKMAEKAAEEEDLKKRLVGFGFEGQMKEFVAAEKRKRPKGITGSKKRKISGKNSSEDDEEENGVSTNKSRVDSQSSQFFTNLVMKNKYRSTGKAGGKRRSKRYRVESESEREDENDGDEVCDADDAKVSIDREEDDDQVNRVDCGQEGDGDDISVNHAGEENRKVAAEDVKKTVNPDNDKDVDNDYEDVRKDECKDGPRDADKAAANEAKDSTKIGAQLEDSDILKSPKGIADGKSEEQDALLSRSDTSIGFEDSEMKDCEVPDVSNALRAVGEDGVEAVPNQPSSATLKDIFKPASELISVDGKIEPLVGEKTAAASRDASDSNFLFLSEVSNGFDVDEVPDSSLCETIDVVLPFETEP